MPWSPAQAKEKNSKLSDKQAEAWCSIANAILKDALADGEDESEASAKAIRIANSKFEESLDGVLQEDCVFQEYADNRGAALKVDRERGVIPGVKLLGTISKKGRIYPPAVIAKAKPMYEGLRVNVDHVEPGQRRSLRDRIGLIKNVIIRNDGLYGDFYFNPKHALAEQVAWDAENAPQNLGFSHDSRGASRKTGDKIVVESIDRVLSVDLVANPATTEGLFESEDGDDGDDGCDGSINSDIQEAWSPASRASALAHRKAHAGSKKEDYAYTPSDNPSTWKLPIHDAAHVGGAAAAMSSGGYRGRKVDIPESAKAGVKAKIRKKWKEFHPDKDESEMPESIRESADDLADGGDVLQEVWSPQARAAALAVRQSRAALAVHQARAKWYAAENAHSRSAAAASWAAQRATNRLTRHGSSSPANYMAAGTAHKTAEKATADAADNLERMFRARGNGTMTMGQQRVVNSLRKQSEAHAAIAEHHFDRAAVPAGDDLAAKGAMQADDLETGNSGLNGDVFQEAWNEAARLKSIAVRSSRVAHSSALHQATANASKNQADRDEEQRIADEHAEMAYQYEQQAKQADPNEEGPATGLDADDDTGDNSGDNDGADDGADDGDAATATQKARAAMAKADDPNGSAEDRQVAAEANDAAAAAHKEIFDRYNEKARTAGLTKSEKDAQKHEQDAAIYHQIMADDYRGGPPVDAGESGGVDGAQESFEEDGAMSEIFQEAWSPEARARAAEVRKAHAAAKNAATPEEASAAADRASRIADENFKRTGHGSDESSVPVAVYAREAHMYAYDKNKAAGNSAKAKYHLGKALHHENQALLSTSADWDGHTGDWSENEKEEGGPIKTPAAHNKAIVDANESYGDNGNPDWNKQQESLNESGDEIFQEAWSPESRAAALASRKAKAAQSKLSSLHFMHVKYPDLDLGSKYEAGKKELIAAHGEAEQANRKAAENESDPQVKEAHETSARAHMTSRIALENGNQYKDKGLAGHEHWDAAKAWKKTGTGKGSIGKEMADVHAGNARYEFATRNADTDDEFGITGPNTESFEGDGAMSKIFQEAWSPEARAAALASRKAKVAARASGGNTATREAHAVASGDDYSNAVDESDEASKKAFKDGTAESHLAAASANRTAAAKFKSMSDEDVGGYGDDDEPASDVRNGYVAAHLASAKAHEASAAAIKRGSAKNDKDAANANDAASKAWGSQTREANEDFVADMQKRHAKAREAHGGKKYDPNQESLDSQGDDTQMSTPEREELTALRAEVGSYRAKEATRLLQESIDRELTANGLHRDNAVECSKVFMEDLTSPVCAADPALRKAKIVDRAQALKAAASGSLAGSAGNDTHNIAAYSSSPLLEDDSVAVAVPPANAPLTQRIARFTR